MHPHSPHLDSTYSLRWAFRVNSAPTYAISMLSDTMLVRVLAHSCIDVAPKNVSARELADARVSFW